MPGPLPTMFPVLDITNLASSASFYSATLQPLGLRYLSSSQDSVSAHPTATYGIPGSSSSSSSSNSKNINHNNDNNNLINSKNINNNSSSSPSSPSSPTPPRPVLQLRKVASGGRALNLSHVTLTAPSHAAVKEAYAFALRSSPDTNNPADPSRCRPPETRLVVPKSGQGGEGGGRGDARSEANHGRDHQNNSNKSAIKVSSGTTTVRVATTGTATSLSPHGVDETRARVSDPDGNIMDLVYRPPHGYASNRHHAGSALRRTMSTDDEASRVLNWNYGGAGAGAGPRSPAAGHTLQHDADEPYTLTRRVTTTTYEPSAYEPTVVSPRQASNGMTTGSVVSTLLGVAAGAAAGAALTYGVVSRSRAPPQDASAAADRAPPPGFARRATYPDQWPADPRRRASSGGDGSGGYVDVERTVAKVRYPEDYLRTTVVGGGGGGRSDYDNGRRPRPEYIARYSQVGASRPREAEEVLFGSSDRRSRAPSAAGRSPMSSSSSAAARTRSEVGGTRRPLMLTERGEPRGGSSNHHDGGTYVGSRSKHPPIVQRSYTYNVSPGGGSGSSFTANDDYDDDDDRTYVSSGRGRRLSHSGGAPMVVPVIASPPMHSRAVMGRGGMVKAAPSQVKVTVRPRSSAGGARHRSRSRASTYVTEARGMPVPVKRVSGGWDDHDHDHRRLHSDPEDDDGGLQSDSEDDDSIVPEDSISCVGSRRPPSTYFGSRR